MDASAALIAGALAGGAIATQFGAVTALLLETAIVRGARPGVAGGLGVATVDLAFAAVATVAGGEARTVLFGHEAELRAAAALTLTAIAVRGLRAMLRAPQAFDPARADVATCRRREGPAAAEYTRFLAITAINPLTIVYFTSVAATLSLGGFAARIAFVSGVGAASGIWHTLLTGAAGRAGGRITPPMQRAVAAVGRLIVIGMAVRLACAA